MTQPFRTRAIEYRHPVWPEIECRFEGDHLLLRRDEPFHVVSSGLWRGGTVRAAHFINGGVPMDFNCEEPEAMMKQLIAGWDYPVDDSIGLLTAAKLTHASIFAEQGDQYRLLTCVTAGTGNSARSGVPRPTYSAYQAGTINLFVMIDSPLTESAMVNGIMTATEAKCAALQDLQILDRHGGGVATGTTSDCIVLASSQSNQAKGRHAFAGTATTLGNAIGRLVYQSVYEAVSTQKED